MFSNHFLECFRVFYNVLESSRLFLECSRMFQNIPEYSRMFQNVLECSRMFQNGPECSRMVLNVPEWSRMFQNAPNCFRILSPKRIGPRELSLHTMSQGDCGELHIILNYRMRGRGGSPIHFSRPCQTGQKEQNKGYDFW